MANFLTGLLDAYKNEGKKPVRSEGRTAPIVGRKIPIDPSAPNPDEVLEPEDTMPALEPEIGRNVAQSYMGGGEDPMMNKAIMSRFMGMTGEGKTSSRRRNFMGDGDVSQRENVGSVIDYVKSLPEYSQYQNQTKLAEDELANFKRKEEPRAMSEVGPLLAFIDSVTGSNLYKGYDKESPAKEYRDKLKLLTDTVNSRKQNMFSTLLGAPKDLLLDTDVVRTDDKRTNVNQNTEDNKIKETAIEKDAGKSFVKQYDYYVNQGGAQALENSKASLTDAIGALDSLEDVIKNNGQVPSSLTDSANAWLNRGLNIANPRNLNNQITRVISTEVLPTLRQLFGAQFTEKENTAFVRLMNDSGLSPKQRAAGVKQILSRIESQYANFMRQKDYAENNPYGVLTLRGYKANPSVKPGVSGIVAPSSAKPGKKKINLDELFGE